MAVIKAKLPDTALLHLDTPMKQISLQLAPVLSKQAWEEKVAVIKAKLPDTALLHLDTPMTQISPTCTCAEQAAAGGERTLDLD